MKKFPNYWAVYDNTISTTIPILVSFIYNSSSLWYTNQEGTQSSYLSNNIKAGTYVYLAKDTTTTPITYSGITNYYPSGIYLKKIESKYLDLSDFKLTPETLIELNDLFKVENISDNAGYNYTLTSLPNDSYGDKKITCTYSTSNYGLAKVTVKVPTSCALYINIAGMGSSSSVYVSTPILITNDTGCPYSADTNTQNSYWGVRNNTTSSIVYSYNVSQGTYVFYIKHRNGTPSSSSGYIEIKFDSNTWYSTTTKITKRIITLNEYIQETVNNMFEVGQGGSF